MPKYLFTLSTCLLLVLAGCELTQNQMKMDRAANLEFQDFRDAMAAREAQAPREEKDDGIPGLETYISDVPDGMRSVPLVSVSVNQNIPLREVLFELAKQAGYDLELDPRISGSIIYTARNKPFDMVIERISKTAGLRYEIRDGSLRVELDTPYSKNYKVDYLNMIRANESSITSNIAVVTGDGGEDSGSSFTIESEGEADFWGEMQTNITQILQSNSAENTLRTEEAGQRITDAPQTGNAGRQGTGDVDVQVESLPVDDTASGGGQQGAGQSRQGGDEKAPFQPTFSMNKQAGIISVYANERLHEKIQEYLVEVRRSVTSQVLIEAKVLQVSLNDQFSTGIDWELLEFISDDLDLGFDTAGARPLLSDESDVLNNFNVGYTGQDITAIVQALSRFGTVRALASPRLTALNNQPAVLNVARNEVFFEIDIDITTDEGVTQTEIDSDIRNVPEGVLINVIPSINLDDRSISMRIRPTVTEITDRIEDPSVRFALAEAEARTGEDLEEVSAFVPVLDVQEVDSVLQMESGQVMVMGGLIQDRISSTQRGVPIISEVPFLGRAFKNHVDEIDKRELVIFIKATIVDAPKTIHNTDREIYRTFSGDRRPFHL